MEMSLESVVADEKKHTREGLNLAVNCGVYSAADIYDFASTGTDALEIIESARAALLGGPDRTISAMNAAIDLEFHGRMIDAFRRAAAELKREREGVAA